MAQTFPLTKGTAGFFCALGRDGITQVLVDEVPVKGKTQKIQASWIGFQVYLHQ